MFGLCTCWQFGYIPVQLLCYITVKGWGGKGYNVWMCVNPENRTVLLTGGVKYKLLRDNDLSKIARI